MQVDHPTAAGLLVEAVDILRDEAADPAGPLEGGQGPMRGVRSGAGDAGPSQEAARPVAAPRVVVLDEFREANGRPGLPGALLVAVPGQSRGRGAARAGEHGQAGMARHEAREGVDGGLGDASVERHALDCSVPFRSRADL